MKQFRFSLEVVLRLRAMQRELALSEFAKFAKLRRQLESEMRREEGRLDRLVDSVIGTREAAFIGGLQKPYFDAVAKFKNQQRDLSQTLEQAKGAEAASMEKLMAARAAEEILSKMRNKKLNEHLGEERRREEKILEDLVHSRR